MKKYWSKIISLLPQRTEGSEYRNRRRYRLDFICENTFNRVWSVRMTRLKVVLATIAVIASISALISMLFMFTPLGSFLPGHMRGNIRAQYIDTALKIDSLERQAQLYDAYAQNIIGIISGSLEPDKPTYNSDDAEIGTLIPIDSLRAASDAERRFVAQYEQTDRFNLSVLSPIAAEGMSFNAPVVVVNPDNLQTKDGENSVYIAINKLTPVSAIYRGTVISIYSVGEGKSAVVIQHPNDFISVYSGVSELFVKKGDKVHTGERIAHADGKTVTTMRFELWHNGTELTPTDYINFQ